MPTPWWTLAAVTLLMLLVWGGDRQVSRRRAKRLRRLAERCGFRYSSVDRFRLARRVRDELPGVVADVSVRDLMYRSEGGGYVYAFTAVQDARRVVLHARERCGTCHLFDVRQGDDTLPLGEQYRRLLHEVVPPGEVVPPDAMDRRVDLSDVRVKA